MNLIAAGKVQVSPPPLTVPTTQPAFTGWQITIRRFLGTLTQISKSTTTGKIDDKEKLTFVHRLPLVAASCSQFWVMSRDHQWRHLSKAYYQTSLSPTATHRTTSWKVHGEKNWSKLSSLCDFPGCEIWINNTPNDQLRNMLKLIYRSWRRFSV